MVTRRVAPLFLAVFLTGCGGSQVHGNAVAGERVWAKGACEGCHKFRKSKYGNVGPNLNIALGAKSAAFIRESVINPNSYVERGYQAGIMPTDFGKRFTGSEIDDLVAYLRRR